MARAAGQPGEGLVPVWRLYRAGDFVWATDGADADDFVAGGYQRQFVEFYVSPTPQSCLTAVDRLERDGGAPGRAPGRRPSACSPTAGWATGPPSTWPPTRGPRTRRPRHPRPRARLRPAPAGRQRPDLLHRGHPGHPGRAELHARPPGSRTGSAWLVDHRVSLDLRYAVQIGDLTQLGQRGTGAVREGQHRDQALGGGHPVERRGRQPRHGRGLRWGLGLPGRRHERDGA